MLCLKTAPYPCVPYAWYKFSVTFLVFWIQDFHHNWLLQNKTTIQYNRTVKYLDSSFSYRDSLLFHCFVYSHLISDVHFIKFINAANSLVKNTKKFQSTSLREVKENYVKYISVNSELKRLFTGILSKIVGCLFYTNEF